MGRIYVCDACAAPCDDPEDQMVVARMKHGSGIKDRDDKSRGIEILMVDDFAKINPTDPLRLAKQAERRKRN